MRRARTGHASATARRPHLARGRAPPSVFVVGAGRLGGALALALRGAGWEVLGAWTRTAGRRLPGIAVRTGAFPGAIRDAELVLICVPDRAVAAVATDLAALARPGQVFAHCAGALDLTPLSPVAAAGAAVGSLHPLVAVSAGTRLAGRSCALEGMPRALPLLRRAAAAVGLKPIEIPRSGRARYHAAATLAATGAVVIAAEAVRLLEGLGVPEAGARAALSDLMASAIEGVRRHGLPAALTGPVARGDAAVLEDHLAALEGERADVLYRAVAELALPAARAQGADPAGLKRIARALRRR